jgi:hypothetical protein
MPSIRLRRRPRLSRLWHSLPAAWYGYHIFRRAGASRREARAGAWRMVKLCWRGV